MSASRRCPRRGSTSAVSSAAWHRRSASIRSARRATSLRGGSAGRSAVLDRGTVRGETPRVALIDTPEAAIRLARAIASDIALYNEDKIIEGIENDSLFDLLSAEINEGLNLYRSRVTPELFGSTNFYFRAIVDVLVKGKGHIKSKIW